MMNNPFIIGHAIYLRALERPDATQLAHWYNDPEFRLWMAGRNPTSRIEQELLIEKASVGVEKIYFGICESLSDELVGFVGLKNFKYDHAACQLSLAIADPANRSRHFGKEALSLIVRYAFDTLNLHRIELEVYERNIPAVELYRKAGFVHEATLRNNSFVSGNFENLFIFSLLSTDPGTR